MLEIYMVRHGRTLFNEKDKVQGWCDSPLTNIGQQQARNVGKNMKDIPFTLAFSSPSERAMDTCEAIIQKRIPVTLDKRIKEINFGSLEGEDNSKLFNKGLSDFDDVVRVGWVEEGGENEEMLTNRIVDFFNYITLSYKNEIILITSHGMWLCAALKYLAGKDYVHQPIENCSVSKIVYDNQTFTIEYTNNCSYRED